MLNGIKWTIVILAIIIKIVVEFIVDCFIVLFDIKKFAKLLIILVVIMYDFCLFIPHRFYRMSIVEAIIHLSLILSPIFYIKAAGKIERR